MVHIFHFLQTGMVFENVNPFSWTLNAISSEKSCLISKPLAYLFTWRQDTRFFPACWTLIGQFKFPALQPYAMGLLLSSFGKWWRHMKTKNIMTKDYLWYIKKYPICFLSVSNVDLNIMIYYPTALRRVQITPKTSTNITRYLYSRGPVREVYCCWPIS